MKQFFVASWVLLLSACSAVPENPVTLHDYDNAPEIYIDGSTLFYVARISEENNKVAFELAADHQITALYIESPGGLVSQGIALARLVMDQGLDVYVGPLCASSCANYILPAGKQVYLQPDSILGWHGSSYQKDVSNALSNGDERYREWRTMEEQFFTDVQVSQFVTVCGFDDATLMDKWLHGLGIAPIVGFTYSLDQLEAFGFSNIIAPVEGWNPPTLIYGEKVFQAEYCDSMSWDLE
ncbi:hypothetical protein [Pseudidiomarina salinarum]|uniref:hypothetical protein n=1 Tax=Pseudidiomarina salinarum TaxID=435908 RepID=UPI00068E611A|nr:hypothetical protein [Pseudidiomarina salinarum]RUO70077.1 hypothetical protein CWI79_01010 [Pseudidiomarina salinarum]